ncbi:MAG: glycosyltransferase family 2 protein [Isosphaeraceae bacterium]|nr:glycosyltransferase family 2 protein [Isosphaeraceae bacterium]
MISIVVVNYNTRDLLRRCLASIELHSPQSEVVVVDNGSRDDSAEMVRREFPSAILIESAVNLGFAGGNNLGIERCTGDKILLFNSDALLEDDCLDRCERWMDENPRVGALSPRLMGIDGNRQRCLYRFPSIIGRLCEMARRPLSAEPPQGDGWLAGTCLLLRRTAFEQVGGRLDDRFFMYWEDADLSAKLRRAGWDVVELEEPYIRHLGGASGGGSDETRRPDLHAWYFFGKLRWFAKNRPFPETALLWVLELIELPRYFFRGVVRPEYRHHRTRARVQARVLLGFLQGQAPPPPGGAAKPARPSALVLETT